MELCDDGMLGKSVKAGNIHLKSSLAPTREETTLFSTEEALDIQMVFPLKSSSDQST